MRLRCNVPEAFWVLEERRGDKGDPYPIRSPLGWTLIGPMDRLECKNSHYCVNFTRLVSIEKEEDVLMRQLERFWQSENGGLILDCKVSMSIEDKKGSSSSGKFSQAGGWPLPSGSSL